LSVRKSIATGAAACALALALAPAASAAGTISLIQPCFVTSGADGATVTVAGSGFTPGEEVFAQIPVPAGLRGYTTVTVGADGSFVASVEHVYPDHIGPIVESDTMQIKGVLSDAILAEAPFKMTNLAVETKPSSAPRNRKVTYRFAGFTPGKSIWGHYFAKNTQTAKHKFGKAHGACGTLKVKARLYPGKDHHSKYKVQFDTRKKFNKNAIPRIDTKLTTY
jgi:hypothetical protein